MEHSKGQMESSGLFFVEQRTLIARPKRLAP